jgi:hypothetical protein
VKMKEWTTQQGGAEGDNIITQKTTGVLLWESLFTGLEPNLGWFEFIIFWLSPPALLPNSQNGAKDTKSVESSSPFFNLSLFLTFQTLNGFWKLGNWANLKGSSPGDVILVMDS